MYVKLARALAPAVVLFLGAKGGAEEKAPLNYVMGPLGQVTNWDQFRNQLLSAKAMGIKAVTTDVWWGLVEAREGEFDWAYYEQYAKVVEECGLKWIPILSFHSAGKTVGDNAK